MLARRNDCRWCLFGLLAALATGCATVTPPEAASPLPTSATAGDTTIVAIAPAGQSSHNLWTFSGVGQAVGAVAATKHRIRDHVLAKLGMRFPGLEPTPEWLLITSKWVTVTALDGVSITFTIVIESFMDPRFLACARLEDDTFFFLIQTSHLFKSSDPLKAAS